MNATMTAADVLREARRLIQEKGWCQGAYARDASGRPAAENGEKACRFCMSGAIWRVAGGNSELYWAAKRHLDVRLVSFNDALGRTKAEVLAALDRGISRAEQYQ